MLVGSMRVSRDTERQTTALPREAVRAPVLDPTASYAVPVRADTNPGQT